MAEFEYRGKYNKKLAENYSYKIEKRVKDDATAAKRTASLLASAAKQFEYCIEPEQLLSLRAALSSMNKLAQELQQLKAWAKARAVHDKAEDLRLENEWLEDFACNRWGQDNEAMHEEVVDLLACLDRDSGSTTWLLEHARQKATYRCEISDAYWVLGSGMGQNDLRKAFEDSTVAPVGRQKLRRAAALYLYGCRKNGDLYTGFGGGNVSFQGGLDDFQAWRRQRREAHSVATKSLSDASGQA